MKRLMGVLALVATIAWPIGSAQAQTNIQAATTTLEGNIPHILQIFCGDEEEVEVTGSGVVIDTSFIITNAHVIVDEEGYYYNWCYGAWTDYAYAEPDQWVWLEPSDFGRYDDYFDYAFMYPYDEEGNLYEFDSYAVLANADSMTLAEEVTIMGYPATSYTVTVTGGSVSGFEYSNWIKTDARIDAGNSGGGAFDIAGNLFGIPTAVSGYYAATLGWVQNINAILEDAFGVEVAVRDYETLYTSGNVFCFNDGCYNYAPDESSWGAPVEPDVVIETEPDVVVDIEHEDTVVDVVDETDVELTYSVPEHAAYQTEAFDSALQTRLKGHILLQTQQHGEAWYVHPDDGLRYYMRDGDIAYEMMRAFGLGITDADLETIPSVEMATDMLSVEGACETNDTAARLAGKILLQVEQRGEAWYVHPTLCYRIYLRDGQAAYDTMRYLSLGISDGDLAKLPYSSAMTFK